MPSVVRPTHMRRSGCWVNAVACTVQEFVSAFSQGAGAAIELAQLAEQQPMRVPGTYGSLQVAAAPSPAGSGAPNLRVATLHIPASPSSPGEVADTILSGTKLYDSHHAT